MTVSRVARQILAVLLCAVLLYPSAAVAADLAAAPRVGPIELPVIPLSPAAAGAFPSAGAGAFELALPAVAAPAAPAVDAHPVIAVINQLQAQGALPQSLTTSADAARLEAAAQTLPAGPMREKLIAMAHAAVAAQGSDSAELDQAYEKRASASAAAEAPVAARGWLWRLLPSGLRKAPAAPAPKAVDPKTLEVPLELLRWSPEPASLPESTRSIILKDKPIVGQDNALKSIYFGLKMRGKGYEGLYVSGPEGSGRSTAVRTEAEKVAAGMPVSGDRVVVTNLDNPGEPLILDVSPGKGQALKAAEAKFLASYAQLLPQTLSSPRLVAAKRQIKAEYDKGVKARHAAFAAEVAKARFDGKFGIWLEGRHEEGGIVPMLKLTYAVSDTRTLTVGSPEELERLKTEDPSIARSYEELIEAAKSAAEPYLEKLHELSMEDMQAGMEANQQVERINGAAAVKLVQQLAPAVAGVINGHKADTPEHKAWEERAQKRLSDFQEELAKVRVGEYGFKLFPQGMAITKPDGDKMVPMSGEELQAKLASGELTQEALQGKVEELMAKLNEIKELNEQEHQALHAKDSAPSEADQTALAYVQSILQYAATNYEAFLPPQSDNPMEAMQRAKLSPADIFRVDVLANNEGAKGAPVVVETNPTLERLFGGIEQNIREAMIPGRGIVGVRSIRPGVQGGSFQRANGGFLVLDVMDALRLGSFPALMQAVRSGEIELVDPANPMQRVRVKSKVKVVLIGSPMIKMLLAEHDETFKAVFYNSVADFETKLSVSKGRAKETIDGYLQFFKKAVVDSNGGLMDFTRDGMATLLQFAAREVSSNRYVTAQFGSVYRLMKEADFWAREAGAKEVRGEHVQAAIQARSDRNEVYQRHMVESYQQGIMRVDVTGEEVGQVNGLVVAGGTFGLPQRVLATYTPSDKPFRIEWADQAAKWTGSSADKSKADVEAFFYREFGQEQPITGVLRISFTQLYGGLDGDSATSTMICAGLSAISKVPLRQGFGMTGSANMKGEVQVIGGAIEKSEGFFSVASYIVGQAHKNGLLAVIIPWMNAGDLQLKPEVVQAVRESRANNSGRFNLYRVQTIGQDMELLSGGVPYQTIKDKVAARLVKKLD